MPSCVQFFKRGESAPTAFNQIDQELCEYLGRPVDPKKYVCDWYSWLAMFSAMGKSFEWIKEASVRDEWWGTPETVAAGHKIIDWFAANYRTESWHEMK